MSRINQLKPNPVADKDCLVQGVNYRISVLTERLIRLEYNKNGIFEDRATQKVIHRNFPVPLFTVTERENRIDLITGYLQISYDKENFSGNGLSIRLNRQTFSNNSIWHYGETGNNLKGTARTLDAADGPIELEDGLLSRDGFSVLDDSASMVMEDDGWVAPPLPDHKDIYFWGYGHDYTACLNDFFSLCGKTPLLPRYALGNWWSRYHAYTEEEYLALIDRFREERLPFSVAVIDMDWHYVKLEEKYGSGWTGYTWNKELFPHHEELLRQLHEQGYHVTLNVHPADGVRGHETSYVPMAKELGVDYEKEVPISFDIANPEFLKAYFKYLHHPLEMEGIDFWWIDWQQGNTTRIPGLDPLWMLNHYHYSDNQRDNQRAMVFSRYAGIGSHRYPVGFSGDSIITWESLNFQPYFTATASNAGYGWWSHDIGGHMGGCRDDELITRWVQFGVFSPIMRLHSSSSYFTGKEPWNYGEEERNIISEFLRLRHRLQPYLYTMNMLFHTENQPLIQPMYYRNPEEGEAYEVSNQYYFGSELIVHPITEKMIASLKAGRVTTWLPEGIWFDIFTGLRYRGGRKIKMYRTLKTIPVLARAGAIIPMVREGEDLYADHIPDKLDLYVFSGEAGEHTMYEDDGISMDYEKGQIARTLYRLLWEEKKCLTIFPALGELSLLPAVRNYRIKIYGITEKDLDKILVNGKSMDCNCSYDERCGILIIELGDVRIEHEVKIWFKTDVRAASNQIEERVFDILNRAQIAYHIKEQIYSLVRNSSPLDIIISSLDAIDASQELKEMIREIIVA